MCVCQVGKEPLVKVETKKLTLPVAGMVNGKLPSTLSAPVGISPQQAEILAEELKKEGARAATRAAPRQQPRRRAAREARA